ncbi:Putative aliphatic sulfonates transport permease protein SsuC [Jannaschia seosinensis]|uniref:Putative aliphatic sulfonates transport permease protein SsuC n=1 Tax=Jannaschia seosinensis TaxID=313367 RepID=A0A0M7BBF0_9RHOB|nr:ABC transporter permease [Jannaschia seosinensis]CUH39721.1 Putative aliphatic sulfonates transport permease protein SsuC [Jannaschia seosinensis]
MTDMPLSAPGAAIGRSGRVALAIRGLRHQGGPILAVVAVLLALWYLACIPMNAQQSVLLAERAGAVVTPATAAERRDMGGLALTFANPGPATSSAFAQDRPRLPAPHQVAVELWNTTIGQSITSKRSLVWHAGVTLAPTLLGFLIGSVLGTLLAIGIVHSRVMDLSVMPWAIASQTIPILAIAPMIIVVLNSIGIQGLLPKAIISAYLSFFPVTVGMVKGLRAPAPSDLDLMRTWNASGLRTLVSLRLPASLPYLFASLKVAVAASLVGAIVGELPTGATAGLGARLLAGSYYGQTVQIWSALFGAAIVAAGLVAVIALTQRAVLSRMGLTR